MKSTIFLLLSIFSFVFSYGQKNALSDPLFGSLPRVVNLKSGMPPVKDQELRNSCAYFAVTAMLETEIKRVYGREVNLSEEYFIYQATHKECPPYEHIQSLLIDTTNKLRNKMWQDIYSYVSMPGGGMNLYTPYAGRFRDDDLEINCAVLLAKGAGESFVGEEQWPYHPSFGNRNYPCGFNLEFNHSRDFCTAHFPPPARVKERSFTANYRIGYFNFPGLFHTEEKPVRELYDMLKFLSVEKKPLLFWINLDNVKSDSVLYTSIRLYREVPYSMDSAQIDTGYSDRYTRNLFGHNLLITGYDLNRQVFYVRNSWGDSWGDKGYGLLPMNDIVDSTFQYADLVYPESLFTYMTLLPDTIQNLPEKLADSIKLNTFDASVKHDPDGSLRILVNLDAENQGLHDMIIQSVFLVKDTLLENEAIRMAWNGETLNKHVKPVIMLPEDRKLLNDSTTWNSWVHLADSVPVRKLVFSGENQLVLHYPPGFTNCWTLRDLLADTKKKVVLKVACYSYDDIHQARDLKHYFFEIDKESLQ